MQVARFAWLALLCAGCRDPAPERAVVVEPAPRRVAAPAETDVGSACADVGELRACFGDHPGAVHGVLVVPRPLPSAPRPARGWRCGGVGSARTCEDRALETDAFACRGDVCTRQHPRLPDDGEWECAELDGAVLCHGGGTAAGTVPGPADPAWLCGPRRGAPGERICVDFSPDRPELGAGAACRFEYLPGRAQRTCRRGAEPALGRACGACPAGMACAGGRCLPLPPSPECWLDADCGGGVCLLGSCRGGRT